VGGDLYLVTWLDIISERLLSAFTFPQHANDILYLEGALTPKEQRQVLDLREVQDPQQRVVFTNALDQQQTRFLGQDGRLSLERGPHRSTVSPRESGQGFKMAVSRAITAVRPSEPVSRAITAVRPSEPVVHIVTNRDGAVYQVMIACPGVVKGQNNSFTAEGVRFFVTRDAAAGQSNVIWDGDLQSNAPTGTHLLITVTFQDPTVDTVEVPFPLSLDEFCAAVGVARSHPRHGEEQPHGEDQVCTVCLQRLDGPEPVVGLRHNRNSNCGVHFFHTKCAEACPLLPQECPNCRQVVVAAIMHPTHCFRVLRALDVRYGPSVVLSRDSPAIPGIYKGVPAHGRFAAAQKLAITFLKTAMDGMDVNAVLHVERVLYAAERLECMMALAECRVRGELQWWAGVLVFKEYMDRFHTARTQVVDEDMGSALAAVGLLCAAVDFARRCQVLHVQLDRIPYHSELVAQSSVSNVLVDGVDDQQTMSRVRALTTNMAMSAPDRSLTPKVTWLR
jgi:hypothetical protein